MEFSTDLTLMPNLLTTVSVIELFGKLNGESGSGLLLRSRISESAVKLHITRVHCVHFYSYIYLGQSL